MPRENVTVRNAHVHEILDTSLLFDNALLHNIQHNVCVFVIGNIR